MNEKEILAIATVFATVIWATLSINDVVQKCNITLQQNQHNLVKETSGGQAQICILHNLPALNILNNFEAIQTISINLELE